MVIIPCYGDYALFGTKSDGQQLSILESGLVYPLVSFLESIVKSELNKKAVYPNLKYKTLPLFKTPDWSRKKRWYSTSHKY